ncbi:MAG TPA: hypothetical protein VEL76_23630, partial [Gemmataceae bacterium]|nr:hypothetical protein [Gemmataceae bacterium]
KDNGRQLVALWSRYGPQLGAVAEAAPLRAEAERWRLRIDAYDRFRTVLKQPASTERGIANAWDVLAQAGGHPDADGDRPRAEQAHRRADLLDQVRPVAVAETEDNDRQLDRLWDSVLLTGCPERDALKPRVQAARGRLQTLAALQTAIDEANRGVGDEERVAAVAASLPVGYPHRNVQRVAQARVRVKLTEDFLKVVQNPSASDRDVADAWDRLTSHGKLPRAAAVHRSRAEQARARVELLDRLRALPAVASEDNDRQFDRLWDEALLTNCAEAATLRPCHQDMRRRLEVLDALQQIIAQVDRGAAREEQILSAAASLPSGYAHRLAGRVKVAYQRAALKSELSRALEATPPLDRVIARVWEKVRAAGSLRLDKVVIERCTVAVQRRDCLDRLDAIDADLPLDQQDAEWLRLWDEELLRHCHDADAAHVRYTQAVERRAAWQALEKALAEGNAKQVRKLATDPLLTDYPPLLAAAPQIHDLLHRAEAAEHIFAVLAEGKVGAFTADDLRFIAEHEELFKAHKTQIVELLERWLVTEGRLEKLATPFVVNLPEGTVTARWTWPHFGRISYCLVAADARRFYERPEDCKTYRLTAEGHRPNTGIVLPVSPRGQSQLRVTVWPVIDLKWCKVTGARLIMGPPTTGGGGGQR